MFDSDFLSSLPSNSEEAFAPYEAKVRQECCEEDDNGNKYLDKQRYLCFLYGFIQQRGIGPDLVDPTTLDRREFEAYFPTAEKKIIIFSAMMALKAAQKKQENSCSLSLANREEIHYHIKKIRTLLNGMPLEYKKKEALINRLIALEREVDLDRTRSDVWASYYFAIKKEIKEGAEYFVPVLNSLEKIADVFAKGGEWLDALPPPPERLQLSPPRKTRLEELEDEIPF